MVRIFLPLAFVTAVLIGSPVTTLADDHRVRVYSGVTADGENHSGVVIHRVFRAPYDPDKYRRVARRTEFPGHHGGRGAAGSFAKPVREAETRPAATEPDYVERPRRRLDLALPRDRIIIRLLASRFHHRHAARHAMSPHGDHDHHVSPRGDHSYHVDRPVGMHHGEHRAPPPADPNNPD